MIHDLINIPLGELKKEAFRLRKLYFSSKFTFSIPDTISYSDNSISIKKNCFPAISITGNYCSLICEHCKGKILESMIHVYSPEDFLEVIERFRMNGASGVLVSGGSNQDGEVPLEKFIVPIRKIKEKDPSFRIIVHTGLLKKEVAKDLKTAGIDQVLIDVIGDDETIKKVYHLDKRVRDYEDTLWMLKENGHRIAPHIIVGHHFGEIKGEWKALEIVSRVGVETIVLVVIKPLIRNNNWKIPEPEVFSRISAIARILNPETQISMGCIRPSHPFKAKMEKEAIDAGINTIAYPLHGTIEYAKSLNLEISFMNMCCSLAQP